METASTLDLGPVDQIPVGEGRVFMVGRIPVAIFRDRDDNLFATQALCPHKGGPLADGITGDGQLQCPLHSFKFELTTGNPIGNDCKSLKTYAVDVNGENNIEITVEKPRRNVT